MLLVDTYCPRTGSTYFFLLQKAYYGKSGIPSGLLHSYPIWSVGGHSPDGSLFQRHRRSTRTGRQAINPARLIQGRIDYILFDREWTGTVTVTTGEKRRHLDGALGRGYGVL